MPNDAQFITGEVPDAMREGVELDRETVAQPTRIIQDMDGQPAQLIQHRFPRPVNMPQTPPQIDAGLARLHMGESSPSQSIMAYDFPLLPGVQCRVTLQGGELKADHLEQLVSLLQSHCDKLREQEVRVAPLEFFRQEVAKERAKLPKRGRPKKVVEEVVESDGETRKD